MFSPCAIELLTLNVGHLMSVVDVGYCPAWTRTILVFAFGIFHHPALPSNVLFSRILLLDISAFADRYPNG